MQNPTEWTQASLALLVFEFVRDELLADAKDFTPQSNLVDSGLESLGLTQLMLAVEDRTGIWVDESLLTPENLETSETLAACIHEQLPK